MSLLEKLIAKTLKISYFNISHIKDSKKDSHGLNKPLNYKVKIQGFNPV